MSERFTARTNETENTVDTAEIQEIERPYSAPTLRKLGGGLMELTLGSSSAGIPDANSQYNWGEEDPTL
jgi:hypothetical protein